MARVPGVTRRPKGSTEIRPAALDSAAGRRPDVNFNREVSDLRVDPIYRKEVVAPAALLPAATIKSPAPE